MKEAAAWLRPLIAAGAAGYLGQHIHISSKVQGSSVNNGFDAACFSFL